MPTFLLSCSPPAMCWLSFHLCGSRLPRDPVPLSVLLAPPLFATIQHVLALGGPAFVPQLAVSAPHALTVLLYPVQVGIADEVHDVFEPHPLPMQHAGIRHPAQGARRLLLLLPLKDLLQLLTLDHLQHDFGDGLSEAMLLSLAVICSCILAEKLPEEQSLLCPHDPIICFHLEKKG